MPGLNVPQPGWYSLDKVPFLVIETKWEIALDPAMATDTR